MFCKPQSWRDGYARLAMERQPVCAIRHAVTAFKNLGYGHA
jgi:hypothetical protein